MAVLEAAVRHFVSLVIARLQEAPRRAAACRALFEHWLLWSKQPFCRVDASSFRLRQARRSARARSLTRSWPRRRTGSGRSSGQPASPSRKALPGTSTAIAHARAVLHRLRAPLPSAHQRGRSQRSAPGRRSSASSRTPPQRHDFRHPNPRRATPCTAPLTIKSTIVSLPGWPEVSPSRAAR